MQPLPLTPELTVAIEALYTVFQEYPLRPDLLPCPCCHSVDSERPLYSRPLRKLRPEDLQEYAHSALLTWGNVDDFRHFLPRIFEIVLFAEEFSLPDREIVFAKLYHGEWRWWPEPEQKAVQQFLFTVWRTVIRIEPSGEVYSADDLESWLCALAQAENGLAPYLDEWLRSPSRAAVWNLAVTITRTGLLQTRQLGINAFWQGQREQLQQLCEWLRSDAVRKKLENAAEMFPNEPFTEELLAAAMMVD